MTNVRVELKPCPFCGRNVDSISFSTEGRYISSMTVNCSCGIRFEIDAECYEIERLDGPIMREYPYGDALDIWNRRKGKEGES